MVTKREIILLIVSLILLVLYIVASLPRDIRLNECYSDYNDLLDEVYYGCICKSFETNYSYKINQYVQIRGYGNYGG